MKIKISGGTPDQQEQCRSLTHHVCKALCGTRMYNLLDIEIMLMTDLYEDYGQLGNCMWTDDPYRPREFDIEVDSSLSMRYMLTTLAHELVHVKQFAKGEMAQLLGDVYKWQGSKIEFDSHNERACMRVPWEVEARGLEEVLFIEWAEDHKIIGDWVNIEFFDN